MTNQNSNRTPWILVTISMVLLFLFVGYWNFSTYSREKKQLAEDVEIQLQLAYTEVKDSELIFFIRTQLTDSITDKNFPDSISIFLDEHPMFPSLQKLNRGNRILDIDPHKLNSDTTIILDFNLDGNFDEPSKMKIKGSEVKVITTSKVNSLTLDGSNDKEGDSSTFRFDIKQVDISGNPIQNIKDYHLFTDSLLFREWTTNEDSNSAKIKTLLNDSSGFRLRYKDNMHKGSHTSVDKTYALLKEKLIANNLPSEFKVIQDPNSEKEGLRVKYKTNGLGFSEWIIDLENYQFFLLNKMIPTLLFSLLLLGMIGLAFWTLLTNWIKQNRLVVVKNEFINNMTHELKTPIATVGVALEAISKFDLKTEQDKAKEYIDISRNEVSRLSLLVDKVLNIAAFDSKDFNAKTELVDLNKAINDTIASLKLRIDNNNLEINYTNDVAKPVIFGDKLHLTNVIHNIIDNSIKYSEKDPVIDIHLSESKNNYQIKFKDNGKGIPKEYQDKIFDRFFRVPSEDKHDVKGHGLGLNYVQNIIENLGGKISVESNLNQGTEFIITLPKNVSDV